MAKRKKKDNTSGSVTFSLVNPANDDQPLIYDGVTATLDVDLTNEVGTDISLIAGASASALEIFMPEALFDAAQVQQIKITKINQAGWEPSYNSEDQSLVLTWSGPDEGNWPNGSSLTFIMTNVQTSGTPGTYDVQINFNNFKTAGVPFQKTASLILNKKPVSTNVDLDTVLNVALDNEGLVYVSSNKSPLTNILYLNFKNIGSKNLYDGKTMWTGTPKVSVSFVYGTTSGALAPDDKSDDPPEGSAWNISTKINVDQTAGWQVTNPSVEGQANAPVWILEPIKTNQEIIGINDQANVSFAFQDIISLTPPGATQMYLQFTGFMQNENTIYNDALFILPINKIYPPNPGAIDIWSPVNSVVVTSEEQNIAVPLTWSMFDVAKVVLNFQVQGVEIPDHTVNYGVVHPALNYDSYNVQFKGLTESEMLTAYCSAYSDQDILLNKRECTVPLKFPPVIKSFTIELEDTAPPDSTRFRLQWDIAGQDHFEITAQNVNGGNEKVLPISQSATSYIVSPIEDETIYTLKLYLPDPNNKKSYQIMDKSKHKPGPVTMAQAIAVNQMPVGTIISYGGSKPPNGWLLCNGEAITEADYPNLYAVIGGTLPDLLSRFVIGAGQGEGLKKYTLNEKGGAENVTLTTAQIPSHSHQINNGDFGIHHRSFTGSNDHDRPFETSPDSHLGGTNATGGGQAHENIPPYFALTYIIKF